MPNETIPVTIGEGGARGGFAANSCDNNPLPLGGKGGFGDTSGANGNNGFCKANSSPPNNGSGAGGGGGGSTAFGSVVAGGGGGACGGKSMLTNYGASGGKGGGLGGGQVSGFGCISTGNGVDGNGASMANPYGKGGAQNIAGSPGAVEVAYPVPSNAK